MVSIRWSRVCGSRMKAASELAGIGMTYTLVQATNLQESENAFVAHYRIDTQMVT